MDTVKIGKYIAGKRKVLGMTQAQVAEKLEMSDKSVSKWERGICLPDVSVYMALCEILGISLNEFIAGEDIEPAEVLQKSEENLIQVTEDGEHRKRKLKKIIVLLAVFGSVMAGILIYLLTFKNQPRVNYIEPLAQDSTEMNIAGMLSDADGAFLYDYAVDKEIKGISFELAVYKKGALESESSLA